MVGVADFSLPERILLPMSTKDRKITHRVLLDTARLANAKELKAAPFGLVVRRCMKEYLLMFQWRSGGRLSDPIIIGSPSHVMVAINAVLTTVAAMAVPVPVVGKVEALPHLLTIQSLSPVSAECFCGKWALQASGAMTKESIEEHWRLHAANAGGQ
jgi:hypothetical protein